MNVMIQMPGTMVPKLSALVDATIRTDDVTAQRLITASSISDALFTTANTTLPLCRRWGQGGGIVDMPEERDAQWAEEAEPPSAVTLDDP